MRKASGDGARRASTFWAEPSAVDRQPAGSKQGAPELRPPPLPDAALSAGREAPGVAASGLLLSTCPCGKSSLTTLRGTDSPREVGRRGVQGEQQHVRRCTETKGTGCFRESTQPPSSACAWPPLAFSRVRDLPGWPPLHNGKDFYQLPAYKPSCTASTLQEASLVPACCLSHTTYT